MASRGPPEVPFRVPEMVFPRFPNSGLCGCRRVPNPRGKDDGVSRRAALPSDPNEIPP